MTLTATHTNPASGHREFATHPDSNDHGTTSIPTSDGNASNDLLHTGTAIIRFQDLEPVWYLPGAKEPGFMRWLVTWVGGPPGFVNPSLGSSAISNQMVVGYMSLPTAQRQEGLHAHTVAEIYIILKGQLLGWDGRGESHVASTGDCIYIPAGVPHGVRCYGSEDAEFIWVHDGVEKKGASIYFKGPGPFPQDDEIRVVRFKDLEPNYSSPKAKEAEFIRWNVSFVGGDKETSNYNLAQAVRSQRVHIGLLALDAAQKEVPFSSEVCELYVLLNGRAIVSAGPEKGKVLGKLDGVYFGAKEVHAMRNYGKDTAYFMRIRPLT